MGPDPVNTALAIGTIPLFLFAGYVAYRVMEKCLPEFRRLWKETRNESEAN